MLEILSDPAQTGLVAVCTPEEMPVNETIELADRIREETTVRLSAVVVNRVLPELFGRQEEAVFDALRRHRALRGAGRAGGRRRRPGAQCGPPGRDHATDPGDPSGAAAGGIDPSVPMLYLPYLFTRSHGLRTTRQVAASLGEELGF